MSLTFIDTNRISHVKLPGSGEYVEILNNQLCGAKNVVGSLRWLHPGERVEVRCDANKHQLVYLMEGEAAITLDSKEHKVGKGSGVYVGPSESVTIKCSGSPALKLFHLVVPHLPS